MTNINIVDPRLRWFVDVMRSKMSELRNQQKDDWRNQNAQDIFGRIQDEVLELQASMFSREAPEACIKECADVANCAMMLADWIAVNHGGYNALH